MEHHFLTSFSMSPCPEVLFGALSRLTKRVDEGRPTRFDAEEVIAAAQDVATRLWAESGWSPVLAR